MCNLKDLDSYDQTVFKEILIWIMTSKIQRVYAACLPKSISSVFLPLEYVLYLGYYSFRKGVLSLS